MRRFKEDFLKNSKKVKEGAKMFREKRLAMLFLVSLFILLGKSSMGLSFSANPSKISASYTKNKFTLPEIKITNNDTEMIQVFVKPAPLGQDSSGSAVEGEENYRYSISKYVIIKPEERNFSLRPGETFTLHPQVELPPDFNQPNGFALIEVECATISSNIRAKTTGVLTTGTIGVLVLLDFPNHRKNFDFKLKDITVERRNENEFRINAIVENTGNYLTEYKGNIEIKDTNGNLLATLLLKPKSILPEHSVKLYATWVPENLPQEGIIIECEASSAGIPKQKIAKAFKLEPENKTIKIGE